MIKPHKDDRELDRIEHESAAWILRRDRGLSAAEQDALDDWLATDPRHRVHFSRYQRHWERLDELRGWQPNHSIRHNPDLLAPPARFKWWMLAQAIAAVFAVALTAYIWRLHVSVSRVHDLITVINTPIEERVLEDGSEIELNRKAVVTVDFTRGERLVHLERGEANFKVAKNSTRPFIVDSGGVRVRAVGTAFDVRFDASAVAVLVTEGRVNVYRRLAPGNVVSYKRNLSLSTSIPAAPVVEAGQRAIVSLGPSGLPTQIATVSDNEMARLLAWTPRQLDFTAAPLSDIVAEFNRHNPVQLTIVEPELAALRISASFRSDNLGGFVRLLEASFRVRAEYRGVNQIVLRRVQ